MKGLRRRDGIVAATLAGVAVASLLMPTLLSGRPSWWALPALAHLDAGVVAGAAAVAGVIAGGLYAFEAVHRARSSRLFAALLTILVTAAISAVFYVVGPITRIGDWDWVLWSVETGKPIGKWYGVSMVYVWFHRWLGQLVDVTPMQSVRLCSSLAGACACYGYFRVVDFIGLTRALRAWPFLYMSAFGVIGVSLAHVEIYAVVVLAFVLLLWCAAAVLSRPLPLRVLLFSGLAGLTLAGYVSSLLLVPACLGVFGFVFMRAVVSRRSVTAGAAVCGLFVAAGVFAAIMTYGPEPHGPSLWQHWFGQLSGERSDRHAPFPVFYPPDVFWPLFGNLLRPRYWLAGWHLRDLVQHAYIGDRGGVALALVLLVAGLLRLARRRAHPFTPAVVFLLGVAVSFCAYAFLLVNVRRYPWDWDMYSYVALTTNVLAAALLASSQRNPGPRARTVELLVVFAGLCSVLSGMLFLSAYAGEPPVMGAAKNGLRLAATPARIDLSEWNGAGPTLWFWLYNDTDEPVYVRPGRMTYRLLTDAGPRHDRSRPGSRRVLGGRHIGPRAVACLADVFRMPPEARSDSSGRDAVDARWAVTLERGVDGKPVTLESNPVRLVGALGQSR